MSQETFRRALANIATDTMIMKHFEAAIANMETRANAIDLLIWWDKIKAHGLHFAFWAKIMTLRFDPEFVKSLEETHKNP